MIKTLTKEILEYSWPLTKVEIIDILRNNNERTVLKNKANEGTYIAKAFDSLKTEDKINRETLVFDFLKSANFPNIPTLLKTKSGKRYENVDETFAYVMEYVDGEPLEPTSGEKEKRQEPFLPKDSLYGSSKWAKTMIKKFGLEVTMRPRGRPRKGS